MLVVAAATRAVAAEPEDGAAPGVGAATPAAGADSLASTPAAPPRAADPRNATLGAVFPRAVPQLAAVHAGVDALSAAVAGQRAAARFRPLAGLEIHPPMHPRSSLIGDVAWVPSLVGAPDLGWVLGIGVRFQAVRWASVELAVRAREAEELGASTVLLRLNAVWDAPERPATRKHRDRRK